MDIYIYMVLLLRRKILNADDFQNVFQMKCKFHHGNDYLVYSLSQYCKRSLILHMTLALGEYSKLEYCLKCIPIEQLFVWNKYFKYI